MSENLKPADNIIPDQVEQNTCPAHFCCTHPPTHSIRFILRRDLIKLAFTVKTCAGARAPTETQPTILDKAFFELGSKSCIARLFPRRNRDVWISRNSQFNSAQVAHIGKIGNYISLTNQDKWRK